MGERGDAEKGEGGGFCAFLRGEGGYAKICHEDKRGSAMTLINREKPVFMRVSNKIA